MGEVGTSPRKVLLFAFSHNTSLRLPVLSRMASRRSSTAVHPHGSRWIVEMTVYVTLIVCDMHTSDAEPNDSPRRDRHRAKRAVNDGSGKQALVGLWFLWTLVGTIPRILYRYDSVNVPQLASSFGMAIERLPAKARLILRRPSTAY